MGCKVIDIQVADTRVGIKQWAEADRPREKMQQHGRRHLTDAELISILLGTGNQKETALDLSKRILAAYGNDLSHLGTVSVKDLCKFTGIGEAKAVAVIAALELGRRLPEQPCQSTFKVLSSHDAYIHLLPHLRDLDHEEFWILIMNRGNHLKALKKVSSGGQSSTIADPKIVFRIALEHQAASIIIAHNHPSGNVDPSKEDLALTTRLANAGKDLELPVLDHLILGGMRYYSFRDEGIL